MHLGQTAAASTARTARGLALAERPVLARGDPAFGNKRWMAAMAALGWRHLVKLKQAPGVKRLIQRRCRIEEFRLLQLPCARQRRSALKHGCWQRIGLAFGSVSL